MDRAQFIAEATPMMQIVNDQFAKIFDGVDPVVHQEVASWTAARVVTRWSGSDKAEVLKYAARHAQELGSPHHVSVSEPYRFGPDWAVDVTRYVGKS